MSTSKLREFFSFILPANGAVNLIFAFHSEGNVMHEQRRTHVDWLQSRAAARPARWLSSTLWLVDKMMCSCLVVPGSLTPLI